jgi:isoaspartyl peptidase/L-asparaginase-like protein (Ntn-hydrolase superfamily)
MRKNDNGAAVKPVMVASENGRKGMAAAMALLRSGGRALDAVEMAARITEDDPDDHTVGYSGLPNILGEVELDASIMDGSTLKSGAVAALRGYGNPILVARQVMQRLPHVLLAGQGAARFAMDAGFEPRVQLTAESQKRWRARFAEFDLDPDAEFDAIETAARLTRPHNLQTTPAEVADENRYGTVNFLALDTYGNLASSVSTSGLGWKYPGRVGDSPIVGAGNYCDNRYGASACTGMGEMAITVSTARSVVLYMKMGMSMQDAGAEALRDLAYLGNAPGRYMNIVALTPDGRHAGFTTVAGKQYIYMDSSVDEPTTVMRSQLPFGS